MVFRFSKPRPAPIAIDFGSERLKLLQLIPGQPAQLIAAASVTVPGEARQDIHARRQFLADALPKALKSQPFKGRRVICALPAYQTLVQNLEVGGADQANLASAIADQLRQRMNVDPSRMVIRHHVAGQIVRDGATLQQVLCLAASRELVMQYVELCGECGLDVVGMHSEPMAIARAFEHLHPADADKPVCYIDIGAATTKLVIAHGPTVVFDKTVHAAGDHMRQNATGAARATNSTSQSRTQHAAAAPQGSADANGHTADASQDIGLAMLNAAAPDGSDNHDGVDAHESASAPGPTASAGGEDTVDCLVDELQMCLRYHRGLFPKHPVQKLVFLGGEARQVETCQRIARGVRVAAQLGDPLAGLARVTAPKRPSGVDLDESQPAWAVPFGLCHSEANL